MEPTRTTTAILGILAAMAALGTPGIARATTAQQPGPNCRGAGTGPVDGPSHPGDGAADPAGRIAYAVVGRHDDAFGPIGTQLYAVDPDGSDRVLLLDCDVIRPQWSPDGTRLAFTIGFDDGSWHVATIAADGGDLRVLTSGPGIFEIPSWSPDGTWLAYDGDDVHFTDPSFQPNLWRINADGTGAQLLGDPDSFDAEPRISPDGTQVVFLRWHPEQDWAGSIVVRDLASGDEHTVVAPTANPPEHPEWSPDGRSLVFNGSDWAPDAGTIYRLDLDQADADPVVLLAGPGLGHPAPSWPPGDTATGPTWGVKPVYSPDGAHVVFVCHRDDGADDEGIDNGICIMDADGTDVTVVVDEPGVHENHTAWGRRGHENVRVPRTTGAHGRHRSPVTAAVA